MLRGQAYSGAADVDGDEADDKGQGGRDLEVDEALNAHTSDAFEIAMAGDAGDESGEDERSDDGLDEAQKDVAEDTQTDRGRWGVEAQFGAGYHRDKDPRSEGAAAQGVDRQQPNRGTAQADGKAVQGGLVHQAQCDSHG